MVTGIKKKKSPHPPLHDQLINTFEKKEE